MTVNRPSEGIPGTQSVIRTPRKSNDASNQRALMSSRTRKRTERFTDAFHKVAGRVPRVLRVVSDADDLHQPWISWFSVCGRWLSLPLEVSGTFVDVSATSLRSYRNPECSDEEATPRGYDKFDGVTITSHTLHDAVEVHEENVSLWQALSSAHKEK